MVERIPEAPEVPEVLSCRGWVPRTGAVSVSVCSTTTNTKSDRGLPAELAITRWVGRFAGFQVSRFAAYLVVSSHRQLAFCPPDLFLSSFLAFRSPSIVAQFHPTSILLHRGLCPSADPRRLQLLDWSIPPRNPLLGQRFPCLGLKPHFSQTANPFQTFLSLPLLPSSPLHPILPQYAARQDLCISPSN